MHHTSVKELLKTSPSGQTVTAKDGYEPEEEIKIFRL